MFVLAKHITFRAHWAYRTVYSSTAIKDKIQENLQNYINGDKYVCSNTNDHLFNIEEPATGIILGEMRGCKEKEVDAAVQAALTAQRSWTKLSGVERSNILIKAADLLESRKEEVARLEVVDTGKPIVEARWDVQTAIDAIKFYSNLAPTLSGQHYSLPNQSYGYTIREPLGVIGGIGAWNFPIQMAGWKSAPALACGNAVVYKPSQFTPLSAVELGKIYKEAGLPDGLYNVIQGGAETGSLLCKHPGVAKVTFTGSVDTGKLIMKACADGIKYVTLELGGKSPLILFDDCDIANAVNGSLMANYLSQGQVCSNGTRVFIHSNIFEKVVKLLKNRAKKIKIGNPHDESTSMGAMINFEHASKVMGFIERAKTQNCDIICGGEYYLPEDKTLHGGRYISPCIIKSINLWALFYLFLYCCSLIDPKDNCEISKEEVFGPVMNVYSFDSEEEVIQRANDSKFGLAAGVFTKDITRAHRVISELKAGSCYVNNYNIYPSELPFGGYKHSGLGRENGVVTVEYFTQLKSVYVECNDVDCHL